MTSVRVVGRPPGILPKTDFAVSRSHVPLNTGGVVSAWARAAVSACAVVDRLVADCGRGFDAGATVVGPTTTAHPIAVASAITRSAPVFLRRAGVTYAGRAPPRSRLRLR